MPNKQTMPDKKTMQEQKKEVIQHIIKEMKGSIITESSIGKEFTYRSERVKHLELMSSHDKNRNFVTFL